MIVPDTNKKRVVVIGGGFAGLSLIQHLDERYYQTVLIDRNNYHQFLPLIYQVASTGLEAASICFPFRRLFSHKKDFYFRMAEALRINSERKVVVTSVGEIRYDYLLVSAGSVTNYFHNPNFIQNAIPMKTVEDALYLRNRLIENLENATIVNPAEWEPYQNIVIVGGGATGVEVAGVLSEMRKYAFKRNFGELKDFQLNIHLVSLDILGSMSAKASTTAQKTLEQMGVNLILNTLVTDYQNDIVTLNNGQTIATKTLIWVSGVTAAAIEGIPAESISRGGRILCNNQMQIQGLTDIFAAGDIALTTEDSYPNGHPQLAQVAMQQAKLIAKNLNAACKGKEQQSFHYYNYGSMATIGRYKAVADIAGFSFGGFLAWLIWSFIHLRSILGAKNKLFVLLDWIVNYFSYVASLRNIRLVCKKN